MRHRWVGILALLVPLTMWIMAPPAAAWETLPSRRQDNPSFVFTPSPPDWRALNIYHLVTDRFADGDPSNNNARGGYDPRDGWKAHGGDFQGVRGKLDYLQALGVTAIWISPVEYNIDRTRDAEGREYVPYHGYMPTDLNRINPCFGSLQDLRDLVDAAHERGIRVVLDIVINHLADLISSRGLTDTAYHPVAYTDPYWHHGYTHGVPFNDLNRFHHHGAIYDYHDPEQYVQGELTGGLDDFRTEDPGVRADLARIFCALIAATDCDGFRVDAVKHVEPDFLGFLMPRIYRQAAELGKTNFLCFGELVDGQDRLLASFTGADKMNSMLYFSMFYTMRDVFGHGRHTALLSDCLDQQVQYDPAARCRLVGFLDNHDQPRSLSGGEMNNRWNALRVALTFLYTSPQIPCLYYGTEQGFDGGNSPWNREDMFDGEFETGPSVGDNFNTGHALFQWVRKLNDLRTACPALATGAFRQRWQDATGPGLYAYTREQDGEELLVVLNTATEPRTGYPATSHAGGSAFVNMLNPGETLCAQPDRTVPVTLSGMEAAIYRCSTPAPGPAVSAAPLSKPKATFSAAPAADATNPG